MLQTKISTDGREIKDEKLRTVLERALAELGSLLLELLDGTLVDTTALVDQVSSRGGLAGIDVSDDCGLSDRCTRASDIAPRTDDVNVGLLLSHFLDCARGMSAM